MAALHDFSPRRYQANVDLPPGGELLTGFRGHPSQWAGPIERTSRTTSTTDFALVVVATDALPRTSLIRTEVGGRTRA